MSELTPPTASTAAYRRFYRLAPDMFAIVDATTSVVVDCNPALSNVTGYSKGDIVGCDVFDLCDPRTVARARAMSRQFVRTGKTKTIELVLKCRDGHSVPVTASVSVGSRDDEGRVAESILILHDITRRKRDEAALRASEARYQDLYHNAPDMFASLDPNSHRIVQCNATFAEVTGVPRERLIGMSLYELLGAESTSVARAALETVNDTGDVRDVDLRLLRGDRPPLDVSMHVTTVHDEQQHLYSRLVLRDITERKRAQQSLRAAHDQMEERVRSRTAELARSNTELEQFAYVASHDLQEPLRKIQAFGERLDARYGSQLDADSRDYLDRMLSAATRMRTLIGDLLQLSRITTRGKPLAPTDLSVVAREVVSDLGGRLHDSGGRVDCGALPVVEADATQMRQLFQNLIGNGLKFHTPGTPPVVTVEATVVDRLPDNGGPQCEIVIADNGIGFDEKYQTRIFAPFQRLHSRTTFQGTGMGLAISRRIVERHRGSLRCSSQPGQGSRFVITLPLRQTPEEGSG